MVDRFFIQGITSSSVKKAKVYNAVVVYGIKRSDGVPDEPFVFYVTGFMPTYYVHLESYSASEIDELIEKIKDIDNFAVTSYALKHPTYFNKNKDNRMLAVKSNRIRDLKRGLEHICVLHESSFKAQDQFPARAGIRLMEWYTLKSSVRPRLCHDGEYDAIKYSYTFPYFPGCFVSSDTEDDIPFKKAYVRIRAVARTKKGVENYMASYKRVEDYIAAVSVSIDNADGSSTEHTFASGNEEKDMRDLHAILMPCDTVLLLNDNYFAVTFLASRMAKYKLRLSRVGGKDYSYRNNYGEIVYCFKGRHVINIGGSLLKEYAANTLEAHGLKDFVDHSYFYGPPGDNKPTKYLNYDATYTTMQTLEEMAAETLDEVCLLRHICEHSMQIPNMAAVAQLCDHPIQKCIEGGQQMRIFRCLYRECIERNFYIDDEFYKKYIPIEASSAMSTFRKIEEKWARKLEDMDVFERKAALQREKNAAKKKFRGGYVHDPKPGLYTNEHIFCCDFAALYPSIIIGYVLCYCSVMYNKHYKNAEEAENDKDLVLRFVPVSDNISFPVVDSYKGERPRTVYDHMINRILSARKQTKREMKVIAAQIEQAKERGDLKEVDRLTAIYKLKNSRQLAQKVTANSGYGFNGTTEGKDIYAAMPVSAVTTAYGRQMNMEVSEMFTRPATPHLFDKDPKDYTPEDIATVGFAADIKYGDTDSVICQFPEQKYDPSGGEEAREAALWKYASYACDVASLLFPKPNELECEADYRDVMFFGSCDTTGEEKKARTGGVKKKYIAMINEGANRPRKLKIQGFQAKRRDTCKYASVTALRVIDMIWKEKNYAAIMPYLHDRMRALVEYKIPLEDLVITCRIKGEYANPTIHQAILKENVRTRDGRTVKEGERLPFVYVRGPTVKGKTKTCTEHPKHLKIARRPVDIEYYLDKQLRAIIVPLVQFIPDVYRSVTRYLPTYMARARGVNITLPKRTDIVRVAKRSLEGASGPPEKRR